MPTTRLVFAWFCPISKALANPKSDILGFISLSNRTLLALRSLWITLSRESSWRYKIPFAIPLIMLNLSFQSSCFLFSSSDRIKTKKISQKEEKKQQQTKKKTIIDWTTFKRLLKDILWFFYYIKITWIQFHIMNRNEVSPTTFSGIIIIMILISCSYSTDKLHIKVKYTKFDIITLKPIAPLLDWFP